MRILVTNDDGVHAPGLAALVRSLARAANRLNAEIVVAAPLVNHSGASAAVGTVYERDSISYRRFQIAGANEVAVYGLDASPALSVLVAALGGFGPKPDIVASGINLGVNVGRSVLHSGTVGAVLTGAQLGVSGLAVSMRSGVDPECWETAAEIAVEIVAELATAPPRTVLNLNVPSLPIGELRGVRRGRISTAGIVKAASM
ncbi:MAG: 5'/3'-nucleotidase SurE, partial [Actinobacteria bacterium]|nr:5'/3'-nucleotidase SurE [Actinomycetota bacterium]